MRNRDLDGLVHDLDPAAEVDDPPDDWSDPVETAIWKELEKAGHLECADWTWNMATGRVWCHDHPQPLVVGYVYLADIEAGR